MMTEEDFQKLEKQITPTKLSCVPWDLAVRDSLRRYEDLYKNGAKAGVFTGYSEFDTDTGGLRKGAMTVVCAETGGCKSTFAANIMNYVAIKRKKPVAVFSFEMLQEEFVDISFAINATVNRNAFNTGRFNDGEFVRMTHSVPDISQSPLYVFDQEARVEDVEEACHQLHAGTPLELVIVDYLQIVTASGGFGGNREQQVAHIARRLSSLANTLRCPVLALSQLNEDGQVRESRAIAHAARLILKLERDDDDMILKITKGSRVLKKDYKLKFDVNHCHIT